MSGSYPQTPTLQKRPAQQSPEVLHGLPPFLQTAPSLQIVAAAPFMNSTSQKHS